MLVSIGLILLGVVLLVVGGELLLRGAVGLATLLRLTPAVIGLTVVAAGTSVPELAVSGAAAIKGKTDIAVANVIGSNIFNITIIVGMCALIRPIAIVGNTIRLEYPVLAVVTGVCVFMTLDGVIDRRDASILLAAYALFIWYLVSLVRRQATAAEKEVLQAEVRELTPPPVAAQPRALGAFFWVIFGVGFLAIGAESTVAGAVQLATRFGWSERLVGLTIVSIGTGLPEVVASLVSSIRGRSDVALANAIGSNLFNMLVILGISANITPLPAPKVLAYNDCLWMFGVTLLLLPMMLTGRRLSRFEGGLLVGVYVVYMTLLIAQS